MARRLSFGVAVLALALFLTSCGGSDEGGGTDPSPTASPSGTNSGNGNGNNGNGGGNGNGGDDGFEYVPWGPDDPPIPGQYAAFAATSGQDLSCESVDSEAPGGGFWDLAAAVCRAIRGDDGAWPNGTVVPEPPNTGNAVQDCLDDELGAMLERALGWHSDNPGRRPKIPYPSAAAMSPCRYRIYDVRLITDADSGDVIAVAISVPAGTEEFAVTVDGQQVDDSDVDQNGEQGDGLDELVVWLEPQSKPRTVRLTVFNGRGTDSTSVDLPGAANTGTPSATESPASTGSPSATESPTTPDQQNGGTGATSASARAG